MKLSVKYKNMNTELVNFLGRHEGKRFLGTKNACFQMIAAQKADIYKLEKKCAELLIIINFISRNIRILNPDHFLSDSILPLEEVAGEAAAELVRTTRTLADGQNKLERIYERNRDVLEKA